jgi:two-component system sensor histidine kinase TctE
VIRREVSPAGTLTIPGHGKLTGVSLVVLLAFHVAVIPIFIALALISLIVTPWIVRRSLAGVARISREAEQINVDQLGRRLSEAQVPSEIAPLVRAVNDALGGDVERLAKLAEQLLDLQRRRSERADEAIDLASLIRRVVGDLAPLLRVTSMALR